MNMKRIYSFFAAMFVMASVSIPVSADITGNGFYRVRNYGTTRWANMVDNKGAIDENATSADLHSLELLKDTETIFSDPGSVVYITALGNYEYDVAAQGTSIQSLLGYAVYLRSDGVDEDGEALYRIYGKYNGYTRYIADGQNVASKNEGQATINVSNTNANNVKWYILPVEASSDNYFGPKPTVKVGGKMYNPLYASFAYTPYSEGVKVYYIGRVGNGMAEMIEISGTVPPGTPVIFECAGEETEDNKVQVEVSDSELTGNSLKGVYFNFKNNGQANQTAYNPKTMRILGECSDGSLGFITSNISYIPANSSYLVVPEGSPEEIKCVTTAEYDAGVAGVKTISCENVDLSYSNGIVTTGQPVIITVTNMGGQTVAKSTDGKLDLKNLAKGIYIVTAGNKTLKVVR